jgi:hypothetical protein
VHPIHLLVVTALLVLSSSSSSSSIASADSVKANSRVNHYHETPLEETWTMQHHHVNGHINMNIKNNTRDDIITGSSNNNIRMRSCAQIDMYDSDDMTSKTCAQRTHEVLENQKPQPQDWVGAGHHNIDDGSTVTKLLPDPSSVLDDDDDDIPIDQQHDKFDDIDCHDVSFSIQLQLFCLYYQGMDLRKTY